MMVKHIRMESSQAFSQIFHQVWHQSSGGTLREVCIPATHINRRDFESNIRFDEHGGLFEGKTKFSIRIFSIMRRLVS